MNKNVVLLEALNKIRNMLKRIDADDVYNTPDIVADDITDMYFIASKAIDKVNKNKEI